MIRLRSGSAVSARVVPTVWGVCARRPALRLARENAGTQACSSSSGHGSQRMQSLSVLTFNISGHNLPALGPPGLTLLRKHELIGQLVLRLQPQLLSLQELFPDRAEMQVLHAALQADGYTWLSAAPSHNGATAIYMHSSLGASAKEAWAAGPCAVAALALPSAPGRTIYFSGCHLEPYAEGAPMRLAQMQQLVTSIGDTQAPLIIAGDTNMRKAENKAVEALGLGDAFMQAGQPRDHNYSFNGKQNMYYGEDTRPITARYDRVYLRGCHAREVQLLTGEITQGSMDCLSDHYPLHCTLDF